jgi:hypothetical protein
MLSFISSLLAQFWTKALVRIDSPTTVQFPRLSQISLVNQTILRPSYLLRPRMLAQSSICEK